MAEFVWVRLENSQVASVPAEFAKVRNLEVVELSEAASTPDGVARDAKNDPLKKTDSPASDKKKES